MTDSLSEQLKDDLGYLGLNRSAECFATLAEEARAGEWRHIEYLARVVGEQANATVNRKLAARLRFARFPFRRTLADFDFQFQPSVDRKLIDDLATLRLMRRTDRSSSWASRDVARPTWPWLSPPRQSRPGIGATSPPPTTW